MRININNQIFGEGKLMNVLSKDVDFQFLKENNWFLENDHSQGFLKEIKSEGVCFLSFKLNMHKNDEIFISHEAPIFKLHFEFEGEVQYKCTGNEESCVLVNKETYGLVYMVKDRIKIESNIDTKNSVEVFFDEDYIRGISGNGFNQLLSISKESFTNRIVSQKGVFISDEIVKIIKEINGCEYTGCKRQVYLELKIKELMIVSLTVYEENYKSDEVLEYNPKLFQNIENYIKKNLKKELTIQDLSVLAAMNTSKFKKCFKQFYGTTVFKYITTLRIERAKKLIQQKSYTISQASYEVGYKNPQHFTVAFKKKLGYLPSKLKKNLE